MITSYRHQNELSSFILPYSMRTGALSPGLKRPECETDHSPPPSDEIKKAWKCTSTPPQIFVVLCIIPQGQLNIQRRLH